MMPSPACEGLIRDAEGRRLRAYQDSRGVWTIGIGHTRGVRQGMTCTEAQAETWLEQDLAEAEATVNRLALPCTQNQFDALVSFVFNEGPTKFAGSTLLHLHRARDYAAAAGEFGKWIYCDHKVLPGLIKRRAAEAHLYLGEAS
jgi:lysozyme